MQLLDMARHYRQKQYTCVRDLMCALLPRAAPVREGFEVRICLRMRLLLVYERAFFEACSHRLKCSNEASNKESNDV